MLMTILLSAVPSFIVCTFYYLMFKIGLNKWLEKFFEEKTQRITTLISKDKK